MKQRIRNEMMETCSVNPQLSSQVDKQVDRRMMTQDRFIPEHQLQTISSKQPQNYPSLKPRSNTCTNGSTKKCISIHKSINTFCLYFDGVTVTVINSK